VVNDGPHNVVASVYPVVSKLKIRRWIVGTIDKLLITTAGVAGNCQLPLVITRIKPHQSRVSFGAEDTNRLRFVIGHLQDKRVRAGA
jgi:hypothetical protein